MASRRIGDYEIELVPLGKGSFGMVFEAWLAGQKDGTTAVRKFY